MTATAEQTDLVTLTDYQKDFLIGVGVYAEATLDIVEMSGGSAPAEVLSVEFALSTAPGGASEGEEAGVRFVAAKLQELADR